MAVPLPDTIDGERILYRAKLTDRWRTARCLCGVCATLWWMPPLSLTYWLCGAGCRREESDSFELVVTPTCIVWSQMSFSCFQMCCQRTERKSVPLDKVLDVVLVSDCCGDMCCAEARGMPYRVQVQTAAAGDSSFAEIDVLCVENPAALRSAILDARKKLMGAAGGGDAGAAAAAGAEKAPSPGAVAADTRPVLAVLQRMEAALHASTAALKTGAGAR